MMTKTQVLLVKEACAVLAGALVAYAWYSTGRQSMAHQLNAKNPAAEKYLVDEANVKTIGDRITLFFSA